MDAQDDINTLSSLLKLVDPTLKFLCFRFAHQCQEDAYQAAIIRIWKKIHKVDPSRPSSAKAYLMQAALSGIRDEVRRYRRGSDNDMILRQDMGYTHGSANRATSDIMDRSEFPGILQQYLTYIEETGDMHGAHKVVGMELGVTTARASTLFHEAARVYAKRLKDEEAHSRGV